MALTVLSQLCDSFSESTGLSVHCFCEDLYQYNIYIVCCSCDADELESICKLLTNCIAIELQSGLQSVFERYNIYLLLFSENADMEQRIQIEQDNYCCRKIVLPEGMPTERNALVQRIENRLFKIRIPDEQETAPHSLKEVLSAYDNRLPAFIQKIPSQITKEIESEAIKILLQED